MSTSHDPRLPLCHQHEKKVKVKAIFVENRSDFLMNLLSEHEQMMKDVLNLNRRAASLHRNLLKFVRITFFFMTISKIITPQCLSGSFYMWLFVCFFSEIFFYRLIHNQVYFLLCLVLHRECSNFISPENGQKNKEKSTLFIAAAFSFADRKHAKRRDHTTRNM